MKGLLAKDFRLLKVNRDFIILVIIAGLCMINFSTGRELYPMMFISFIAAIVGAGTITYDEMDNGNAFLFTMPFSRKDYVLEKYLLTFILYVVSLAVMSVCALIVAGVKGTVDMGDFGLIWVISLIFSMIFQAWMITINLKFGGEKGRIANIAIFFVAFAAAVLFFNVFDPDIGPVVHAVSGLGLKVIAAAGFVAAALIYAASIAVSLRIMAKKEF